VEDQILDLVARFGYVIVGLGVGIESMGVPVPGETSLVVGAILAAQGRLNLVFVILVAWAGAVIGDNIGYAVGRRWGRRLVRAPGIRRFFDERRLAVAERFFQRRGWLAVFFGRFVALLRIFAGPLAGMNHMRWRTFFIANATGGITWVSAVSAAGYTLGNRAFTLISRLGYGALGVVVVMAALALWVHVWRGRRERAEGERILAARDSER